MKYRICAFIIVLICAPAMRAMRAAQDPGAAIEVLGLQNQADFGEHITFMIDVRAGAGVARAELRFQEGGTLEALALPAALAESAYGEDARRATATLDLSRYSLTPFARTFYTWRITDRAGHALTVGPLPFVYEDCRFSWEAAARQNITIHSYDRPAEQVQTALNLAVVAQAQIIGVLQTPELAVIDVYFYHSRADFQTALQLHGYDAAFIEGYADARHNVILLAVPPAYAEPDLRRQLPHELAHIYIGSRAGEGTPPAWLVEGMALLFERAPDVDLHTLFAEAAADGALYPLAALCPAFPRDRDGFALAYAQSYEVVRYIEGRYGPQGLRALLDAYAQGASCRGGVAQGLGISLETLERDWLRTLDAAPAPPAAPSVWPWVALLGIFLIWPAVFLTFRHYKHHASSDNKISNRDREACE